MSFVTKFPKSQIVIADSPQNTVFGTAMIGNAYGDVISASVKRDGELVEITANASLLTAIIANPSYELTLNVVFRADVTAPGMGEKIDFPLAGISGRIMPGIEISWEEKGHRGLSFTAKSWDSLSGDGSGAASVYNAATKALTPLVAG